MSGRPRSGRPEVHGRSARLAVIATATSLPPARESQWSQAMIAGHLRDRALVISPATVVQNAGRGQAPPAQGAGAGSMVGRPEPPAAAPRRLHLPRRAGSQDLRVHRVLEQEPPALQVGLRRRRRARPLPRTPPRH
ncbi:MAG: hypothetical protein ACRDOK_21250 [Streptosporangiaceae bacterium]